MSEHDPALPTLPASGEDFSIQTDTPAPDTPTKTVHSSPASDMETETGDEIREDTPSRKVPHLGTILKKSILCLLSAVSLLVFSCVSAAFLSDTPTGSHFFTRLMLGEFFGGIDNLSPLSTGATDYLYLQPENSSTDSTIHPLERILPLTSQPSVQKTLSAGTLALSNETPYTPDMNELLTMERAIPTLSVLQETYGDDAPIVLILHTHGTEAFAECAQSDYRSTDNEKNIVSAGTILAEKLNESGIRTLHCTTQFDAEDFTMAYYKASLEIRNTLEEYPSISYILDIHRDSIEMDGMYIAPTTQTENGTTAQMMFVIGTDYGGSGHTTWKKNLSLAARLHTALNQQTPQIMRDINLRSASFNEQYSNGSLLLEIGACASTREEIHKSAALFADALIKEIIGDSSAIPNHSPNINRSADASDSNIKSGFSAASAASTSDICVSPVSTRAAVIP